MWGAKCGRAAAAAALVTGVVACSDEPAPLELRGGAGVAEAPADPTNARQLEAPVWEAVLSPLNSHVGTGAVTGKAVMTMDEEGNLTVRLDVKGVVPGQLHTPMVETRLAKQRAGGDVDALLAQRQKRIPLGFMGDGRDTAAAVLFLASDEARFVTGTELVVDGGRVARCD